MLTPAVEQASTTQAPLGWTDILEIGGWRDIARTYADQFQQEGGLIPSCPKAEEQGGHDSGRSPGVHPMRVLIDLHQILVYREEEVYGEAQLRKNETGPRVTFCWHTVPSTEQRQTARLS